MRAREEIRDLLVDVFQKAWHHADEFGDGAGSRTKAGIDAVLATGLVAIVEDPPTSVGLVKVSAKCPHCDVRKHQIDTSQKRAMDIVRDAVEAHVAEAHGAA